MQVEAARRAMIGEIEQRTDTDSPATRRFFRDTDEIGLDQSLKKATLTLS
jgi:hypothetical protein